MAPIASKNPSDCGHNSITHPSGTWHIDSQGRALCPWCHAEPECVSNTPLSTETRRRYNHAYWDGRIAVAERLHADARTIACLLDDAPYAVTTARTMGGLADAVRRDASRAWDKAYAEARRHCAAVERAEAATEAADAGRWDSDLPTIHA